MSGPGLGTKTIPQAANEPSERRGETKVKKSYVKEENEGRLPPPPPPTLLPYEAS